MMTIREIKQAINNGQAVHVNDGSYEVIKDSVGQFLIHCFMNDNYIGLHGRVGGPSEHKANFPLDAFYRA